MTPTTTIRKLGNSEGATDEEMRELARAVSAESERGQWYDGPGSTNILDWLAAGQFDGTETIAALAWDE